MQPNHPQQQGYGMAQPYGDPPAARASAGAAAFAGLLGLLAAGGLVWAVIEYFVNFQVPAGDWPTEIWVVVGVRGGLALLLLVVAGMTMARRIGAAWTLVVLGLLAAATVLLEPLVFGADIGGWFDELFAFADTVSIAIVAGAGLGLLAAIVAIFAGASRSGGEQEYPGY